MGGLYIKRIARLWGYSAAPPRRKVIKNNDVLDDDEGKEKHTHIHFVCVGRRDRVPRSSSLLLMGVCFGYCTYKGRTTRCVVLEQSTRAQAMFRILPPAAEQKVPLFFFLLYTPIPAKHAIAIAHF